MLQKNHRLLLLVAFILMFIPVLMNKLVHANDETEFINIFDESEDGELYTSLDGDWYFFHEQLLSPEKTVKKMGDESSQLVKIPSSFKKQTGKVNTFGTYVANIKLPEEFIGKQLSIHVPFQYSAYRLFIDGEEIASNGHVGHSASTHQSEMAPETGEFVVQSELITIMMHVSSFEHIRGGFENSIHIGDELTVTKKITRDVGISLFLTGSIFVIGIFLISLGLYNLKEIHYFVFGLLSVVIALRTIFTDPFYYTIIFVDSSWLWGTRLEYIFTEAAAILFVILFWIWHRETFSKLIVILITTIFSVLIIITLFTKPVFFQKLYFNVFLITIPFAFYTIYVVYQSIRRRNKYIIVNIIGAGLIFIGFFNDYSLGQGWHSGPTLMLPAVSSFILLHVIFMGRDFAQNVKYIEMQNKELVELNKAKEGLLKRLEAEVESKEDFLMQTSYELRNPLHGMINISRSILQQRGYLFDEKTKEDLNLQISIGQHMSRAVEDLIDITRLREQNIKLQREQVHLLTITTGIVDMFSVLIENKDIDIKIKVPKDYPLLYVDKTRLIQIMFNIVHNAVKYTTHGTITIDADIFEGQARIYIQDTGIGISKNDLRTIFDIYQRVGEGSTVTGKGLGLGLSISKQLIELHGGEIGVSSILGKGTVITFTLPFVETTEELVEKKQVALLPERTTDDLFQELPSTIEQSMIDAFMNEENIDERPKILAIDDDTVNLKILKNILSEDQYEIELVTCTQEALEKLDETGWDLVISDVMMPNMSGYELTRIIRERFTIAELPILLLTARKNVEDVYTAFLAGANDYVSKPVDTIELNVRVRTLTNLQAAINDRLKMEAAWLQAQIRPHFLMNTLNSIISLSEIDIESMQELIEHFVNYLQSSFYYKNLDKLVPLEDELVLLDSYLFIEKVRFGDRLNVRWDVDDNTEGKIPPLAIQTLVENAINHGILQRIEGGTVTIQIKKLELEFEVSVIDDGIGIDNEELTNIFSMNSNKEQGIGLVNTEQRLQRLFGTGLTITSTPGLGTVVSFKAPLRNLKRE